MIPNKHCITGQTDEHIHWFNNHIGIHYKMVDAYQAMRESALKDGISINIASGFRSYHRQFTIWQNKFSGKTAIKNHLNKPIDSSSLNDLEKIHAIMLYSALPGASRHHWGCDIDVYADNVLTEGQKLALEPWEYEEGGPFYPLTCWLNQHADQFGFYWPYDRFRGGVAVEPWHLSYREIANCFQQHYHIETITEVIADSDIRGKQTLLKNLPQLYTQYITNVAT